MNGFKNLAKQARETAREKGWLAVPMTAVRYLLRVYLVRYHQAYLYEYRYTFLDEASFPPRLEDYSVRIITSNEEADQNIAAGYEDFRRHDNVARRALDLGAVAFCIYAGKELANLSWVATTRQGKDIFDPVPYQVDFENGVGWTGGVHTTPRYRNRGLMTYCYYRRIKYLAEHGFPVCRGSVITSNAASNRVHVKFNSPPYARGHFFKILKWCFWKERLL